MLQHIIKPKEKDLGEFTVRRTLPSAKQKMVGPWIFFDHMGPATFAAGSGVNVRPHPHINLATVTYLFEGEILHRDSLGSLKAIRPGDINLMVAGKGIVHSERETEEVHSREHTLHGLQLWHALPEEYEEVEPAFFHYPVSDIPGVIESGVSVRVMIGSAYGVISPVKTFSETLYVEARLNANASLVLPKCAELAVYVVSGSVVIDGQEVSQYEMAIFSGTGNETVVASSDARIALVGGEPLGKRYLEWNFVSSRPERIDRAKARWLAGEFPKVPGDEVEFIPLPGHE